VNASGVRAYSVTDTRTLSERPASETSSRPATQKISPPTEIHYGCRYEDVFLDTSCSLVEVYRRFGVSSFHQGKRVSWKGCTDFGRRAEVWSFRKRPFQGLQGKRVRWKRYTDFGRRAEIGSFSKRLFQGLQISLTVSPYSYWFADFNNATPLL
jgi:hypothetical protein